MDKTIRILHVFGKLNVGGAESRIMDLYRNIDRNLIQFDFVVHSAERGFYEDEIESLGGRVFRVPRFKIYNMSSYKKAWREFLTEHKGEFKMIQGHITSCASVYLPIAKECGIDITIAHARSAGVDAGLKGYLTRIMRRNLADKADYLFTCSKSAGVSVFGRKAVDEGRTRFVPNAIDVSGFAFDSEVRNKVRAEIGIENRFVIGHVGRFHYAKNHEYLLKIYRDFCEDWYAMRTSSDEESIFTQKTPVLILLGDGDKMPEMKALAIELGISKSVLFLGNHQNISDYYQAMDYFVYPSRYEGLPGTVVEAQASGLPVLMSDSICEEVVISDLVSTMSIQDSTDNWAQYIIDYIEKTFSGEASEEISKLLSRIEYNDIVKASGFDIHEQVKEMTEFYLC